MRRRQRRMKRNLPGPAGLAWGGASAVLRGLAVALATSCAARLASAPSPSQRGSRGILRQAPMRNVVVTGGSRGLGLAMASTLAAAGYRVIAVARSESKELKEASLTALEAGRGTIEFRGCDLSDIEHLGPFVRSVRADFGAIYGLVNNAGLGTDGVLGTMRDEDIERLVRLN